jgi:hypothetical protein
MSVSWRRIRRGKADDCSSRRGGSVEVVGGVAACCSTIAVHLLRAPTAASATDTFPALHHIMPPRLLCNTSASLFDPRDPRASSLCLQMLCLSYQVCPLHRFSKTVSFYISRSQHSSRHRLNAEQSLVSQSIFNLTISFTESSSSSKWEDVVW